MKLSRNKYKKLLQNKLYGDIITPSYPQEKVKCSRIAQQHSFILATITFSVKSNSVLCCPEFLNFAIILAKFLQAKFLAIVAFLEIKAIPLFIACLLIL